MSIPEEVRAHEEGYRLRCMETLMEEEQRLKELEEANELLGEEHRVFYAEDGEILDQQ